MNVRTGRFVLGTSLEDYRDLSPGSYMQVACGDFIWAAVLPLADGGGYKIYLEKYKPTEKKGLLTCSKKINEVFPGFRWTGTLKKGVWKWEEQYAG